MPPQFLMCEGAGTSSGRLRIIVCPALMIYRPLSWEIGGETVETAADFILGGSKITADGDCSHEIKRRLLLGRKVMTNLDSIFKAETLLC